MYVCDRWGDGGVYVCMYGRCVCRHVSVLAMFILVKDINII